MTRFARRVLARLLLPLFYLLPISRGGFLKVLVMRLHGAKVASSARPSPGLFILNGFNLSVGERTNLGVDCRILDVSPVSIGSDCLIAIGLRIVSGTHTTDGTHAPLDGPVTIGDRVWIGASVTIVGPCTIGDGAIIGANSFVRGEVPAGTTYAGSPARLLCDPARAPGA